MTISGRVVKRLLPSLARYPLAVVALIILALLSLAARGETRRRQRRGERPRLIYGPVPIISIKFMAQAMVRRGYLAKTFVYDIYALHSREDYDYYLWDFLAPVPLPRRVRSGILMLAGSYITFGWALSRFDVFHYFFNGGFLLGSPLQFLEVQLLHLAGKKVVVMPYGSDVAAPTRIRSLLWRQGLMMNYPALGRCEKLIDRRIDYFSRRADFIVASVFHLETLPRWDLLTTHYYPIDTAAWRPDGHYSANNGKNGPVSVVHAPNHRGLKGTEFLIAACQELQAEGYQIDLRLLERLPNSEVKRLMSESDIVAEQFILGYALTAMEGMSVGKPVMSNLSDDYYYQMHRLYTGLDECPIVSTRVDEIKDNLRALITDPTLRRRLGEAGRQYVLKYYSYDSVGRMWDLIYRKIWCGGPIELTAWHPDRCPAPSENRWEHA